MKNFQYNSIFKAAKRLAIVIGKKMLINILLKIERKNDREIVEKSQWPVVLNSRG